MKKLIYVFVMVILLSGCISTSPGSRTWHNQRLQEIETAYQNGEITKAEYLSLKNQADQARATRKAGVIAGILARPQ